MTRQVRVDMKPIATQINTLYNHDEQKSISQGTTSHREADGPHEVPVLAAKNGTRPIPGIKTRQLNIIKTPSDLFIYLFITLPVSAYDT